MAQKDIRGSVTRYIMSGDDERDRSEEKLSEIMTALAREMGMSEAELLPFRDRADEFTVVYDKFSGQKH